VCVCMCVYIDVNICDVKMYTFVERYGVATISRLLKIIGLFGRI